MKLHDYFRDFLNDTVNLSEARLATLDKRVAAIGSALAADAELGPLLVGDVIPQGSYAQRTIINPLTGHEYDADILLPITDQPEWDADDYVPNVYEALNRNSTYAGKAARRSRCVVVDYADPFHVDVVPYVERWGSTYITNRKTNEFELTNPEGFNTSLDDQNRLANGHLVPVIRLTKYLRDYKQTFSVKSVIFTTLLGGAVTEARPWADASYCCDLPTALVDVVTALDDYLQAYPTLPRITDPSCPSEDFNHRWDQDEYANFRTRINGYAKTMKDALAETSRDKSLELWQSVFGSEFEKSPPVAALSQAAVAASDPEQDLERDLKIPVAPRHKVKLVGRVERKDGFRHYALPTRGNEVGKDRWIVFTIDSCTVPDPHEIYWKVRNSGEEAARANQLRGQIVKGVRRHRERTAYRGSHYVDVYIVQDGTCVAHDRQRVVVK